MSRPSWLPPSQSTTASNGSSRPVPSTTKITVKDRLKSTNTPYTPFPPTSRFANQRSQQLPFSLTRNSSKSPPIRSAKSLMDRFGYTGNDDPQVMEQDKEFESIPTRNLRERKPHQQKQLLFYADDDDEDENMEETKEQEDSLEESPINTRRFSKKRKRGNAFLDSGDEDEGIDDVDEDDDRSYVDQEELNNKFKGSGFTLASIVKLKKTYSAASVEHIEKVLKESGSLVKAIQILSDSSYSPEQPQPRTFRRIQRGRSNTADTDDDDDDIDDVDNRKKKKSKKDDDTEDDEESDKEEIRKNFQTLRFFNTGKSQEIQDVTGCTPDQAEKLIQLREEQTQGFLTIKELRETLRHERGLSVKYIDSYVDMMDGYSLVDQIIEQIEELGTELKDIINVWEGANQDTMDEDEEDTGMHLSGLPIANGSNKRNNIDKNSYLYRDAMDGFLTEQPKIVNDEFTLKDYQILGVNWMLLLYRKGISGILADEMGLGKTAQVISFLGRLYELGNKGPHLIIVPTSTISNWLREFERFCPEMNVYSYYGSQQERLEMREELLDPEIRADYQVIVTTYTVATGGKDDRVFLKKLKCKSMILDEGHMVRNCTSARYKHLIALKTPFRLLLTGTPLQNNLQELVSLLMFIMPDMLLDYEEEIRKIFKIKSITTKDSREGRSSAQILSQERIARAKKMMIPFVLRRRKADVLKDLPEKTQVIERCKMTENQRNLYTTILSESKQSYKEALDSKPGSKKKKDNNRFKNIIMELRKAADHPLLFRHIYDDAKLRKMSKAIMKEEKYWDANEEYIYEDMTVMSDFELNRLCTNHKSIRHYALQNQEWMDSGKVDLLNRLLPAIKEKGQKVLLFSQFTRLLDILEMVMDTLKLKYLRLDGETKPDERQELIDQFNEDMDIPVFLLSTKAGGFGINLTSANNVILYDTDFNPQNDRQAEDRAHRVGQTQDVTVYKLVADNSVEEHILSMANIKLRLDRSVSGLGEENQQSEDQEVDEENAKSLLRTVLLE